MITRSMWMARSGRTGAGLDPSRRTAREARFGLERLEARALLAGNVTEVNLSAFDHRMGVVADYQKFANAGGLDGIGDALSGNLLGTGQTWNGNTYAIGAPGTNDVVSSTGQVIPLPSATGTTLTLLATAVKGNQVNQSFTVTYSDNSTQTFTQSFSDWHTPQNYVGESRAIAMGHRDVSNGSVQNLPFYVYGYSLGLNSTKTVKSVKLPADPNVEVLAVDLTAGTPPSSPTPPPIAGNWKLSFDDEFNTLNTNVWSERYWWDGNTGTQAIFQPSNVSVSNGVLSLTAIRQTATGVDGSVEPYTSGLISTGGIQGVKPPGFTFTYGYVEIRTKVAPGTGMWSALWMLPADYQDKAELDVMEDLGKTPTVHQGFYHTGGYTFNFASITQTGSDLTQNWHTFGVDWEPDHITWYVDGVAQRTLTNTSQIFTSAMYLILNLDVGGNWAGPLDSTSPARSSWLVDYVRVWQKS